MMGSLGEGGNDLVQLMTAGTTFFLFVLFGHQTDSAGFFWSSFFFSFLEVTILYFGGTG
jgi:hypothetical protein